MSEPDPLREVRRYPHLTSQDVEALRRMPEDMAREYENLLKRQYRSERRHREHRASALDVESVGVARRVHGEGAGGGWRRGLAPGSARD